MRSRKPFKSRKHIRRFGKPHRFTSGRADINERIRIMFEASPLAVTLYDENLTVIDCNMETVRMFRCDSKSQFLKEINERFYDFSTEYQVCGTPTKEKREYYASRVQSEGRIRFDWIHKAYDGNELSADITLTRIAESNMLVAYIWDLSATKESEEKAREAKEFADVLYEASPMFIDVWDEDFNLIECNDKVVDLLGVSSKEEFLENLPRFNPTHQPCGTESVELYTKYFTIGLEEGYVKYPWTHLDVNGEEVSLEVTYVRHYRQGKRIMIGFNYDLRDVKKLEKQKLEAVEEGSRAKSRFLARMSHEIRTPIAAVLGITEIQLRNRSMPLQTEEAFVRIYESSKTLLSIVNDILDFSKIESGKMPLINNEYDVASLISDAAQLHLVYLESTKNVTFIMEVDENLPTKLIGDALRIRQIINNLLTNAFKYTDAGSVCLSMRSDGEIGAERIFLIVSIQDTGMGMTPEQIDEIESEYMRFHEHEKPFVGGTGLGIPIVYSLTQMMGAELYLQSEVGKGTNATIRIPQKISGTQVLGKEMADSLQNFQSGNWSLPKELAFVPRRLANGKVLVVDDVDTNLYVAEAMLETFGVDIDLCENARDAIDKIKQGNVYDIVFMDHMMPGMDGIEATKILRGMGYDHPIVALTANAIKGQAEMFMENGFSGFMSKPIDIQLLDSYLVRFIKNKRHN